MENFYGGGGNQNPTFIYQFKVNSVTDQMFAWCENYPSKGPFSRWHIEYSFRRTDNCDVIHIEHSEAAKIFRIAFAGEYEELTMKEYR